MSILTINGFMTSTNSLGAMPWIRSTKKKFGGPFVFGPDFNKFYRITSYLKVTFIFVYI